MWHFLKCIVITLCLAAVTAAAIALWRSPDPLYTVQEWAAGQRYFQYDALIADLAAKHGLDRLLLKAVIWRESGFVADKVGKSGERGLMQVGEAAAQDWAKAERIETFTSTDLFDPKTNVEAGAWYLRKALEHWKERDHPTVFALAEYNAGRRRVDRWVEETRLGDKANADDLLGTIDFPSTRRYIEDILARHKMYTEREQRKSR
jgi:soluble lytic murein transglycosylase